MSTDAQNRVRYDYLPVSVRLETLGGLATPVVLSGTPLPAVRSQTFSTAADDQSAVEVNLWIGDRPLVRGNVQVGTFSLSDLPEVPAGEPQIVFKVRVEKDLGIEVEATLMGTQHQARRHFPAPADVRELVETLRKEAREHQKEDEVELRTIESRNTATGLIRRAERRLSVRADPDLNKAVARLGRALASDDADGIERCSKQIEERLIEPTPRFADLFGPAFGMRTEPVGGPRRRPKDPPAPDRAHAVSNQEVGRKLGRIFGANTVSLDPELCFVLMPFSDEMRPVYDDHIRPVVEGLGLRCVRADEIHGTALISQDIWEYVNRARILLADLTGGNANVFYELGLAHAISKDVILLTQSMDDVPFDLKAIRCLVYEFTPRGMSKLEENLRATIEKVKRSG